MFMTVDENYMDVLGTPCIRTLYTNCAQHLIGGSDGKLFEIYRETLDFGKQGITKLMHVKPVASAEVKAEHMRALRECVTRNYISAQLRREDAGVETS